VDPEVAGSSPVGRPGLAQKFFMNSLYALLLGLVQGLTEFLPISSSAHLKIVKLLLGIQEDTTIFDLSCHLGTCLVVVFYFKKEFLDVLFLYPKKIFLYLIALSPLIPIYIFFKPIKILFASTNFLGFCMIGTAAVLFLATRYTKPTKQTSITIKDALCIGICQAAALAPGISRSALTISSGLCRGLSGCDAVSFSFLLSLPAIAGGLFLESVKTATKGVTPVSFQIIHCIIGFLTATTMGAMTIRLAIPLLQKSILSPFGWYCLITGTLLSIFL
jgi:undecaprenyl-diphosphatase